MTIENTEVEAKIDDTIPADVPKAAEDTTMEGDFSPAEKEGLAEYNKMLEAMDKGEDYTPPEPDSGHDDKPKAEEPPPADEAPQQTEEELSALIASRAEEVAAAESALKEAEEKAIALGDQLENGEISQAKYDIEIRRAMREVEKAEGSLADATAALHQHEAEAEQASVQSDPWFQAATSFLAQPGNDLFNNGEHHDGLKQAIVFAAGLKQNADKTPAEIINIAANTYRAMAGISAPAATQVKKPSGAKPAPDIPPMLGQMQAALPNNDESPFSHIASLSGPAFEDAYSKLSQAQREAFMDSLNG